jgi:hypothetical protein
MPHLKGLISASQHTPEIIHIIHSSRALPTEATQYTSQYFMRARGSETGHIVAQLHVSLTQRGGQVEDLTRSQSMRPSYQYHNVSTAISARYSLDEPFIQSRHPQYSSTNLFTPLQHIPYTPANLARAP